MPVHELASPTFVAEGTHIHGSLTFAAASQVLGTVEGDLCQQGLETLEVGRAGWVKGNITSLGPIIIDGKVEGHITSQTAIQVRSQAKIKGTLVAPRIEILPGARVYAEVVMHWIKNKKTRHLRAA